MKNILFLLFIVISFSSYAQGPEFIGEVVYLQNGKTTALEKQKVSVSAKANAGLWLTGIGSVNQRFELDGAYSPVKLNQAPLLTFVVKVKDNHYDPFSLIEIYRFEKNNNKTKRRLTVGNVGTFTGASAGDIDRITFTSKKYGSSSFLVTVPKLPAGQYGFRIISGTDDGSNGKVGIVLQLFSVKSTVKIGETVRWIDTHYKREWLGVVTAFDEEKNILSVLSSDRGQEVKKEIDVDNTILEKIPPFEKLPLITKEDIGYLSISKGDSVKWNDSMESWQGIVIGKNDSNIIMRTSERGKILTKEMPLKRVTKK